MPDYKGVMIFGELLEGKLSPITKELLGIGKKLSDQLQEELGIVLIGSDVSDNLLTDATIYGADNIYIMDDPLLKNYNGDSFLYVLEKLCQQTNPRIFLLGQSSIGRDLAPRLAFRLKTGLCMDCVQLEIEHDSKILHMTRPVYGGNALATYICNKCYPQVASVRAKAMSPSEPDNSRKSEITLLDFQLDSSVVRAELIESVKQEMGGVRLEEADVVVSGGRGIGSEEAFQELERLAKILNGAVGATRAPCDEGWAPSALQIGLTGKVIAPDLYIAIGLSGSNQHLAGCLGSKVIVAINKDPDAHIFKVAHYGVVGDYKKVLPTLIEKCHDFSNQI